MSTGAKKTRRSLLSGIPAATAATAAADEIDPIFAAIEMHKREDRRLGEWYLRESTEEAARACRKWSRKTPVGEIVPTTVAGAAALLALYCKWEPWKNGDQFWSPRAVKNVLIALKRLASRG